MCFSGWCWGGEVLWGTGSPWLQFHMSSCPVTSEGRGAQGSWPTVASVPKKNSTSLLSCLTLSHYSLFGALCVCCINFWVCRFAWPVKWLVISQHLINKTPTIFLHVRRFSLQERIFMRIFTFYGKSRCHTNVGLSYSRGIKRTFRKWRHRLLYATLAFQRFHRSILLSDKGGDRASTLQVAGWVFSRETQFSVWTWLVVKQRDLRQKGH